MSYKGDIGAQLGAENLSRVRAFFASHLCATQRECARALKLSPSAVCRHVSEIRSEWRNTPPPKD